MSESFVLVLSVAAVWAVIGLTLSLVMGRRGHNGFGWLVLGCLLGPLAVALAIDAGRHEEQSQPTMLVAGAPASDAGAVDVLVGYDGSPESAAAPQAVIDLLGDRLGRMTVVSVVPYGGVHEQERTATELLLQLAARTPGRAPGLEVVHGHPSAALRDCALGGGYDLIAVGTRGAGISKAILGSAASELARESKVPVLLVGGDDR
jgi:nucleotide-binding universal stress UspA family protein